MGLVVGDVRVGGKDVLRVFLCVLVCSCLGSEERRKEREREEECGRIKQGRQKKGRGTGLLKKEMADHLSPNMNLISPNGRSSPARVFSCFFVHLNTGLFIDTHTHLC